MAVSRLSSKGQVTIPKAIRDSLGVEPGDLVAYEMGEGLVTLKRVESFDVAYHAALSGTLGEWASPEDNEAFRDI